ncbi:sensor histidine kinase [Pararhodobacter sp. SW119]|uniref:sensor histidine kinase n=1 Tax=Pararhodobacter sp. SW119 TaxID=2780075 RepID=UPI001ADEE2F8|nr:sensor histidine kinase [Pararhodobacter sp. SW119]
MGTAEPRPRATNDHSKDHFNLRIAESDHRIANSLSVTAALLRAQREQSDDSAVQSALISAEARIISIAKFHAYLHRRSSTERVNLADAFAEILPVMARGIGIRCLLAVEAAETLVVSKRMARQLLVIVNELALNALKHGYRGQQGACISVELVMDGADRLKLVMADSGAGLDDDFDPNTCSGLGMKIVSSLVSELGGSMQCRTNGGAQFTITIPLG